jgi:capsular polysaccharide biosynthesis protein
MNLSFSVETIVKVVKRFFLLMIVFALLFYTLGHFLTKRSKSVSYYSYTDLYIHTIATGVDDYTKYIDSEAKYVDTYLLTINTYKFYEELRQQLPEKWRSVSAGYLKSCVSPVKLSESAIIRFTVYSYDADLTAAITKTLSLYMDDYLFNNYRVNSVQIVEDPRPVSPSISQSRYLSLIFAALGIAIAFIIGYIQEIKDRTIRSVDDIGYIGLPVLGSVPSFTSKSVKGARYAYSDYSSSDRIVKDESSDAKAEKKNKKN